MPGNVPTIGREFQNPGFHSPTTGISRLFHHVWWRSWIGRVRSEPQLSNVYRHYHPSEDRLSEAGLRVLRGGWHSPDFGRSPVLPGKASLCRSVPRDCRPAATSITDLASGASRGQPAATQGKRTRVPREPRDSVASRSAPQSRHRRRAVQAAHREISRLRVGPRCPRGTPGGRSDRLRTTTAGDELVRQCGGQFLPKGKIPRPLIGRAKIFEKGVEGLSIGVGSFRSPGETPAPSRSRTRWRAS